MTISESAKLSAFKEWRATLTIGETTYTLLELPSRSLGTGQERGTCTCKIAEFPAEGAGTEASVDITLNNESERFFTGKVDARPINNNPPQWQVTLIDSQNRLKKQCGEAINWSNKSFQDAVREVLNKAGIDDTEIASIHNPGTTFRIAPEYEVKNESDTHYNDLLDELLEFAGCAMLVGSDGMVSIVDSPGWPEDAPTITYANAATPTEYGIASGSRTIGGNEDVVASFKAYGPRKEDNTIPDATFTLTGQTGEKEEKEYRLIQTEEAAAAIAEREIQRRNRQSTIVEVSAPLNTSLRPYDSVYYRDTTLGFLTNTPAIVLATSSNGHMMTVQLSVGAKPPEGSISYQQPPVAQFDLLYERQPISLGGLIAVNTVVEVQSTSYDPNSEYQITSLEWTAVCDGTVEPDSFSENPTDPEPGDTSDREKKPIFVFSTLDGASITLVVESSSGEGSTITKNLAPSDAELFTRCLSMATSDGWKVLAGASIGWRTYDEAGSCTAVPEINDLGPMVAGFSNGKFMMTQDRLATPPEELHDFSSAVRCIDVNQGSINIILAGIGDTLYRSTDTGVTWQSVHAFTDDINYVESSAANPDEIRVCAGQSEVISFDAGANFAPFVVGQPGTTARKVASAPWGHLVVFTGTTNIADAALFEESNLSIDWSLIPELERPVDLATVTPLQYEEGYMLAAGAANSIVRDGLYQQLTYLATQEGETNVYKAVRADANTFQVQPTVNTTLEGGPHKVVNTGGVFLIDTAETVFRIGYGSVAEPVLPPELLVLPKNMMNQQMFHYHPLTGWNFIDIPNDGTANKWQGIRVNPNNPAQWIIWNGTEAYFTANEGSSWIQIYIRKPPWGRSYENLAIQDVVFTGHQGNWCISARGVGAFGTSEYYSGYFIRGTGAIVTNEWANGNGVVPLMNGEPYACALKLYAVNGVVIGGCDTEGVVNIDSWYVIGNGMMTKLYDTPYEPWESYLDANPFETLAIWENNIGHTSNYNTTAPIAIIAAGGSVARCNNGIFVGDREGVAGVYNLLTNPTYAVVAGGSNQVGTIIAGSKRYGVGAPITIAGGQNDEIGFVAMNSGAEWSTILGPDEMQTIGEIAPIIGVLERV